MTTEVKIEIDHVFIKKIMRQMTLLCWLVWVLDMMTFRLLHKRLWYQVEVLIEQSAQAIAESVTVVTIESI